MLEVVRAQEAAEEHGEHAAESREVWRCSGTDLMERRWLGARRSCRSSPEKRTVAAELESRTKTLNLNLTS